MRRNVATLIMLAGFLAGCGGVRIGSTEGLFGEDLFDQVCARCHGADLAGGIGPALGPGSNAAELSDEQIAGVLEVGPGAMPSFKTLSDEQVASVIAYLRTVQAGG